MQTINKLKAADHAVIAQLININEGNTSAVDYSTTVFGTEDGYKTAISNIGNTIIGSQIKNFVNTPLIAEKGNQDKTYSSTPGKGMGMGYIFIDYVEKTPLLVLVVDKSGSSYTYTSCVYDKKEKTWKDGKSYTFSATSIKGFQDSIIGYLSTDVLSFAS